MIADDALYIFERFAFIICSLGQAFNLKFQFRGHLIITS